MPPTGLPLMKIIGAITVGHFDRLPILHSSGFRDRRFSGTNGLRLVDKGLRSATASQNFLTGRRVVPAYPGCQAPGLGRVRVWLNVYSPSTRSLPALSKVTRRAIIVSEGAAFA